MGLINGPWFMA